MRFTIAGAMEYPFGMKSIQGRTIFAGYACQKAFVIRHDKPAFSREKCADEESRRRELVHYREATESVDASLRALMDKGGADEIAILEAQCFMLHDPDFTSRIADLIMKEGHNAPHAVELAAADVIQSLSRLGSEMFRGNISDIQDIASRLIATLLKESLSNIKKLESISLIVADTILPSELMSMDPSLIAGICLDGGGPTSHVAILARAMNIPCVFGLKDASCLVKPGSLVALDAFSATLYIDPDDATAMRIRRRKEANDEELKALAEDAVLPAITLDGVRITLECNIEGLDYVDSSIRNGAEGVGLFRTEFLLMGEGRTYSEDEQVEIYSSIAKSFRKRGKLTIRTYDMGGDKVVKDMSVAEDNPVLGWRAVRFCMDEKNIFRTQLRAILRASACRRIRIMFPMVSGSDELNDVLAFFESVKEECRREGLAFDEDLEVGTMIEVPSAAITSDILAKKVDFFSVGTNDLTQYTIAVDRGNEKISYLYKEYHPAMLRLLKLTADAAHRSGIGLSMCGEMAGNPALIALVIGLGYRQLSMNPASLLSARKLIRSMNFSSAEALAKQALDMTSCRDIEDLLEKFNAETRDKQQG